MRILKVNPETGEVVRRKKLRVGRIVNQYQLLEILKEPKDEMFINPRSPSSVFATGKLRVRCLLCGKEKIIPRTKFMPTNPGQSYYACCARRPRKDPQRAMGRPLSIGISGKQFGSLWVSTWEPKVGWECHCVCGRVCKGVKTFRLTRGLAKCPVCGGGAAAVPEGVVPGPAI